MSIVLNKLICSFKSELPNEIDFAMQVATLLANTDNFSWSDNYPLVDAICSSLHVFTCVCKDNSTAHTCNCYPKFWHKLLTGDNLNNIYLQAATLPPDTEQSYLRFSKLSDHELEDHTKIYRRVRTAAELIKQFSMTCDISLRTEKPNEAVLNNYNFHNNIKKKPKASPSLLKFVSLLLFCDDTPFNLIGLDILSNVASKLSKLPDSTGDLTCSQLVQMFREHCIQNISCHDGDIYIIIRSVEVVSRLISSSSPRVYSNVVSLISEKNLLLRIEQLLTSRNDVNLFLAALECFYRISRHQPHLIAPSRAQHLIKILVILLNCEDKQFFTTNALKRIELIGLDESATSNNSPLSISVRLTAALILRNLATESTEMKQALKYHETLLSEICMTNGRDESKILAECLSLFSSD